jgi:hypothetical protein
MYALAAESMIQLFNVEVEVEVVVVISVELAVKRVTLTVELRVLAE